MRKVLFFITASLALIGCNEKELASLHAENETLKARVVSLEQQNKKLQETADFHFQAAVDLMNKNKFDEAKKELSIVIEKYPANPLVSAAEDKIKSIDIRIAKAKQEELLKEKQKQAKERQTWRSKANGLVDQILNQAMWDMGRGTITPAIDVIKKKIGEPTSKYEGDFGLTHYYVWGASLGETPSAKEIKNAPFVVALRRGMKCGDYCKGSIDYYSYGVKFGP